MSINRNKLIAFVQSELNKRYNAGLYVDGQIGTNTLTALNRVTSYPADWSAPRQFVGFVQSLTHKEASIADIVIDGYWGARTASAYAELQQLNGPNIFKSIIYPNTPNPWPNQDNNSMLDFYGEAGTNQIIIDLPFPMRLAWNLDAVVTRTKCHEKVASSIYTVLENIQREYGIKEMRRLKLDYYGGMYNYRTSRNSTTRLSKHAFGAAIDLLPQENRLRQTKETGATFATIEYLPMIQCFVNEHWKSLGLEINSDWMHFEATS